MQTRKVIFGVGLMITGAIIFLTWYLCYTLMFCAESILVLDDGAILGWFGGIVFVCGFFTALRNCGEDKKREEKRLPLEQDMIKPVLKQEK